MKFPYFLMKACTLYFAFATRLRFKVQPVPLSLWYTLVYHIPYSKRPRAYFTEGSNRVLIEEAFKRVSMITESTERNAVSELFRELGFQRRRGHHVPSKDIQRLHVART